MSICDKIITGFKSLNINMKYFVTLDTTNLELQQCLSNPKFVKKTNRWFMAPSRRIEDLSEYLQDLTPSTIWKVQIGGEMISFTCQTHSLEKTYGLD